LYGNPERLKRHPYETASRFELVWIEHSQANLKAISQVHRMIQLQQAFKIFNLTTLLQSENATIFSSQCQFQWSSYAQIWAAKVLLTKGVLEGV